MRKAERRSAIASLRNWGRVQRLAFLQVAPPENPSPPPTSKHYTAANKADVYSEDFPDEQDAERVSAAISRVEDGFEVVLRRVFRDGVQTYTTSAVNEAVRRFWREYR